MEAQRFTIQALADIQVPVLDSHVCSSVDGLPWFGFSFTATDISISQEMCHLFDDAFD